MNVCVMIHVESPRYDAKKPPPNKLDCSLLGKYLCENIRNSYKNAVTNSIILPKKDKRFNKKQRRIIIWSFLFSCLIFRYQCLFCLLLLKIE